MATWEVVVPVRKVRSAALFGSVVIVRGPVDTKAMPQVGNTDSKCIHKALNPSLRIVCIASVR